MALSPYTIDVGACQEDGTRTVFLQRHQRTCFSTTHREVLHVCLVKWPVKPSVEDDARPTNLEEAEAVRSQHTEEAYQELLGSPPTTDTIFSFSATDICEDDNKVQPPLHAAADTAARREAVPPMENYLCVFHREELADQHGRFTFVQPQTICTAYRVRDTTTLELVLHHVSPRDITAPSVGSGGVFVQGRRLTTKGRGAGSSQPVEHQGVQYRPAADLWWMSSPLTIKPVYVAVGPVATPGTTGGVHEESDGAVGEAAALPGNHGDAKASVQQEECLVTSSIHVADAQVSASPYSSPRQGSPLNESVAPQVEGRTAQGQFDFPRSRSSSPVPHSPPPSSALQGEPTQDSASARPQPTFAAANPKAKFVHVDATVLTQLPLYDTEHARSNNGGAAFPSQRALTVVRTAADELGLAVTTPLYATDCMLWQWWPQRLRLSRLASSASALSVVASPHPSLRRQLLFLYDAHHSRLRVLRTPDLFSGEGGFDLLFSFSCGDLPFVFPCLHARHPAPIAVCNYPRPNVISVYDVEALAEKPSAENCALQMDIAAYQGQHPQRFGDVRLAADAHALQSRSANAQGNAAYCGGSSKDGCAPQQKWKAKAASAKAWSSSSSGSTNGAVHPIRSLLYHYDSCLVLQYDWPGGAEVDSASSTSGRNTHGNVLGSKAESRAADGSERERRRFRRCEGTISYTVNFPCLTGSDQPLLTYMLEAVGAAVGPRVAAAIEYELLAESWRARCTAGGAHNVLDMCALLLKKLCSPHPSFPSAALATASPNGNGLDSSENLRMSDTTAMSMFVDPSMLTLQGLKQALRSPSPAAAAVTTTTSVDTCGPSDSTPLRELWTPRLSGLTLIALHLLFESCRLQEPLWKLLPPLAELNRSLSVQLRWHSYVEFYDGMVSSPPSRLEAENDASDVASCSFSACLPREVLEQCFDYVTPRAGESGGEASTCSSCTTSFDGGNAPELFQVLSTLAIGGNNCLNGSINAYRCDEAAMTPPVVEHVWPLLRNLPETHPITLANQLVVLYRDVFQCAPSSNDAEHSRVSLGYGAVFPRSAAVEDCDHGEAQWWQRVCAQLLHQRISPRVARQVLNTGVAYPLLEALTKGCEAAEATWPAALLDLVGRRDRCPPSSATSQRISAGRHVVEAAEENAVARQIRVSLADDDGVSVRPDFRSTWRDARLDVAQNLFNTVTPISLAGYEDRPEELTGALESLSSRARAMPLGRGMLTMCTQSFKVQDSIPIPPLNLDGRTNDGIRIANKSTEEMMWPLFHNGCAAGLRFLPLPPSFCVGSNTSGDAAPLSSADGPAGAAASPSASLPAAQSITKQWVMYQTKNIGNAASRAGLLLATGILGHLTVLQRTDIFYLLISRQEQYVWREATTMAVMLGLSCSFCGTSSEAVFRCLSVHVQSLNPSAEDIEVSLDVQTAALVSMGLLCQQAPSNTFLVEVFLVEISRLPTDEHCSKREGYVLGAGFGLGQLLLGVGAAHGVPHVEDRLLAFMTGAPRRTAVSTREGVEFFEETMGRGEAGHFLARALLSQEQREATFNSCASVFEGDCYNIFVSGPAAAVALGFMYMQTDNDFIAAKVAPPNRRTAMQRLTPLLCHLRSAMASLICWSAVQPTREWLYDQLPSTLLELTDTATVVPGLAVQQRNYLLMNLAHCLAGHVMAIGLRYAGTLDARVRDVVFAELQGFLSGHIGSTKTPIPAVQRVTGAYETCILSCASALSMIMAGTGDLKVFHTLQHLHRRSNAGYGSHMAVSMSMGLLFLGSGRLTLSNNIASVAALVMAFYPVWPSDPEDNTHHLQALRHLYGLAVVPRVMEAVDAVSHQPVSVPVRIVLRQSADDVKQNTTAVGTAKQQRSGSGVPREIRTRTPCLYPPQEMIERVEVHATQYYPLTFESGSRELTQAANMVFCVMAKDSSTTGVSLHGSSGVARSPLESRLWDWLHRLFHQPATTTAEALTVMDSVKLMRHVQRRLVATAMAGEVLLSADFNAAMRSVMEKRYSYIFLHGGDPTCRAATSTPKHPLYQLIVEDRPYACVLASLAKHPRGTAAFPCDFTSLIASPSSSSRRTSGVVQTCPDVFDDEEENGNDVAVDVAALHRWIVEALHFYGLRRSVRRQICAAISSAGRAAGGSSSSSVARLTCFLRLQAATALPLSTLERVWACCA